MLHEKAIEFCNEYLSNVKVIGRPKWGYTKITDDFGKIGQIVVTVNKHIDMS